MNKLDKLVAEMIDDVEEAILRENPELEKYLDEKRIKVEKEEADGTALTTGDNYYILTSGLAEKIQEFILSAITEEVDLK